MARDGIIAHYDIEDAGEHLYDVTMFGETILTTVIKDIQAVAQWIEDVEPEGGCHRCIGFDLKFASDADKMIAIDGDKVFAILQFCEGRRCLLIQLQDYCVHLVLFLIDPNITFVCMDLQRKIDMLTDQISLRGKRLANIGLGTLAVQRYEWPELRDAGQSLLVTVALGMRLEMPRVETDWDRQCKLTDVQAQKYVARDAIFISPALLPNLCVYRVSESIVPLSSGAGLLISANASLMRAQSNRNIL